MLLLENEKEVVIIYINLGDYKSYSVLENVVIVDL
jgi:hypothetical protein